MIEYAISAGEGTLIDYGVADYDWSPMREILEKYEIETGKLVVMVSEIASPDSECGK